MLKKKAEESQHQVEDLSKQVFVDTLTHVRNKAGYDNYIEQLQLRLDKGEILNVALGLFDCDNLKGINDKFGHDKGNVYLQASSRLICRVFQHSPVFRVGGDEFIVVLMGEDYENRDKLLCQFEEEQQSLRSSAKKPWECVSVSYGVAMYDPITDQSIKVLSSRAIRLCMRTNAGERSR